MKENVRAKGILYKRGLIIESLVKQKIILLIFAVMILVCGVHGISYAQLPSFSDSAVSRSVAENSLTGTDIGNSVTANNFSSGTDRYRLADADDNADSPDSDSFGIGSATGQLTTNTELDFETKQTYQVVIIVERSQGGTWVEATNGSRITVTISVTNVFEYAPLSERTQKVVDQIVFHAPVSNANAVTEAHLRAIKWILINNKSISTLKEQDFDGLSSLSAIWLYNNDLTSLPENVFSGLSNLTQLLLHYNQLTSLPDNIFSDLSKLTTLRLTGNRLTSLPDNIFSGLSKLTTLTLSGNTVSPLPLTISLVKVAAGEFKAVVPSGAPFDMVLRLSVANGIVDSGTTALTVLAGDVESNNSLTVTRIPGTTHAVTVDFGRLPSLPSGHEGYALTRSDLPLTVIAALNSPPVFNTDVNTTPTIAENTAANINIGTPLTAIDVDADAVTYRLKAHADDADDYLAFSIDSIGQLKTKDPLNHETQSQYKVTVEASDVNGAASNLDVTITLLDVYEYTPMSDRTQQVVDEILFRAPVSTAGAVTEDHLEAIPYLILNNESITTLKEKDFEGMWALTAIWLNNNDLTSLPDNIFSGLLKLDTILLNYNPLGSLDEDIFSGLSSLKTLRLEGIQLTSLPPNIFNGLAKLSEIHLNSNQLSSLPDGVFSGLTKLKDLYMNGNTVNPLPLTISLVKVAGGQFKAVAPTGAPFEMVLHLVTANGSIEGGKTSVTIPKGSVESSTLTVTRTPYTVDAVTVDIRNPLPSLPASHQGYAITKSTDLPLTAIAEIPNNTPVFNTGLNTTPEIAENTTAGTNIGTPLTAMDTDTTDTLTYSLTAHSDDADDYLSFTIDGNTGQLKTKSPLDHETQSTYKVTVAVSDNVVITTIDVTITITNVNEAPTFPTSETGTRSIPDNVAVNVNIGAAVSATDPDLTFDSGGNPINTDANPNPDDNNAVDALSYSLGGDDAASFNIDTTTGQLKTKAGVTFDAAIKDTYTVTVSGTDGELSASINVTITVVDATQFNYAPIFNTGLNTTPTIAENTSANQSIGTPLIATDADTTDTLTYSLKAHTDDADDYLAFAIDNMGQLKTKENLDFETQSTYKITVEVSDNTATATIDITITITNVFEYTLLSERTQQVVDAIVFKAPVSTADAVTEAHLEAIPFLLINNKSISALKEQDFAGLSSLSAIWLYNNDLTSLPENVFSGLSNLTQLLLQYNQLRSLPENIFSDLSKLTTLRLTGNRLTSLPDNIFSGLSKLTTLILSGNTVSPLPLTISLVKVAEGEFKAVVPSGAPFDMVLPLSVANGIVDGGATTLTVLAGDVESNNSLTVTRIPGTTHAITVDFGRSLPSLPSGHEGYALTRSDLPLTVIAALNSPPVFNTDVNTTPTIAENTAANINIGTPLTAIDVDADAVTYRLKAHTDDADDYLAFSIDNIGQLKTKDPLNHETQSQYKITVEASDVNGAFSDLDVTITLLDVYEYTLLSDRTQQVVDEILFRAPVSTADAVTEAHLEAIPYLVLNNESISSLKEKDFEGLSSVSALWLQNNDLTSLPTNVFNGLVSLETIILNYNPLGSLPENVFNGLSSLKTLRLEGIQLRNLPPNIFSGLSKLEEIHINYNRLTSLPDGVFSGLTKLKDLYMVGNTVDPLSLPVSLVKVAGGQFKAVAPTGAPFEMVLHLVTANGSIDGGKTSVTIPKGSVESKTLTVTRTSGTTAAVTVDIGSSLPNLPASHQGYAITKSGDLPLTVIDATETSPPIFNTGLNTTPEVAENAAANINIGTPLTATDADTTDTLTYRLMAHTGDADDYLSFTIDENTGQLKTKANVDLDFEAQSIYKVMVEVTDGIFTTTINVTITVKDVNEAPTFPADTDTRDIAENTTAGVNIGNPVAVNDPDTADGDTDVNPDDPNVDALTYSLGGDPDAASFDIDTATGQLKTKATLDYETKDDYEVTVTASDGGTDTASIIVTINIIDVDDTPPTVEITAATTAQNDEFGVTFTFSEAVSGFEASDISLTTTLIEGTGNAAINNLTLVTGSNTQYTAEITLPAHVEGQVKIQVPAGTAQDAAANGNTASSEYTVPVDTIIPSVTITAPMTATGAFSVTITFSEDMTEFDNLVTDIMLSGRAAATVTSLTGSGTTYTANIAPTSNGNLNISVPKNAAKDKANNGNTASQTHTVSIGLTGPSVAIQGVPTDPQNSAFTVTITFSKSVTGFTAADISLGTGVSATVTSLTGNGMTYTATITPVDEVDEEITLSVPAGAAQNAANMDNTASSEHPIQLDRVQPSVTITAPTTAARAFDVTITFSENVIGFAQSDISLTDSTATTALTDFTIENAKEYTATITPATNGDVVISVPAGAAKDAAENQNTESDILTVTVELNNAPVFNTGLNMTPTIAENTAAGTNIDTPLTATDANTGDTLTYGLKAHTDDADDYLSFAIDENTGQLKTKANVDLDFETQSTYKVTVEVSDSIATATIDVTITITNVNEAPTFPAATDTRSVTENTAAGESIGAAITATDPDSGDTLTYSIDATADAVFDIDSTSGQLKTEAALDYESTTSHTVIVTATDSGNLIDTITVTINITNVNEAPTFPPTTDTTLEIAENTPTGENIGDAVAATDPDVTSTNMDANPATSNPDVLVYSLVDADDPNSDAAAFAIDDETGQLETKASLDYETKTSYTVMVKVSDSTFTDTITVTITIIDVDDTKPTVSIEASSDVKNNPQNGAFDVTITFSEAVTGFTASDISLTTTLTEGTGNATVTLKSGSDDDTEYTAEITPPADAEGNVDIQVPAVVAQDAANQDNTISNKLTVAIDTKSPTVSITDVPSTTQNDEFEVTITFSEGVTLTDSGNITTPDSVSQMYSLSGSGSTHTATLSRVDGKDGNVILKVPAGFAKDSAGNLNTESNQHTVSVDWKDPAVTVTVPSGTQTGAFNITITFSETVTDFVQEDISLTDSTATATVTDFTTVSGAEYTAEITPTTNGNVKIKVNTDVAEDAAGNRNTESQLQTVAVNLPAPTVTITGVPISPTNSAFDITIEFSETVTGFEVSDISLGENVSATVSLTAVQGSDTQYTATITPAMNVVEEIVISVPAGVTQNAANTGNTASVEHRVQLDTVKPSITLTGPSSTQTSAFNITITFSETVTDFVQEDISLTDSTATATVTDFTTVSGAEYTAEITPTTNGNVKIKVNTDVAEDAAGNRNTESLSQTVTVSLPAPTVTITGVPINPKNSAFDITIEFSETVTGFDASDISLGGNVSATVSLTEGGTSYTATITPDMNVAEEIIISVPAGAAQNAANTGNTASAEHRVQLDTVKPSITLTGPSGTQTSAFNITITFSETVTDFVQGDISLADSTATAAATDFTAVSGTEYTVEITPTTNGDVKIKVPTDAAQDAANNENTESNTLTVAVTISSDPVEPVNPTTNDKVDPPDPVMFASQNNVLQPDQTVTPGTFELIMDFGQPVTGFEQSDLGIYDFRTDVTITGWQEDGEGKKYTATLSALKTGAVTFTVPENAAEAIDNGTGNDETKLTVFIRDDAIEPNRAPVFATDAVMRTIAENTEIDTAIGAPVTATDPDNDRLTYFLEAHDDAPNDYKDFYIGYNTGQLRTGAALDHETQSTYKVTVGVTDDRSGVDTIAVTITVTDVAETQLNRAPVFAADSTTREIAENTASNQSIGTKIMATDPDGDPLTYSLKAHSDAPNDYKAFSIESTSISAQLKTKAALDYETQSAYKVTVGVADDRSGVDTIAVTITVTDVAETQLNRAPVFAADSTTREIAENTASNQSIGTKIMATDPDGDPLTYSLKAHSDAPNDYKAFSIESTSISAQLKTKAALDYETQSAYKVIVEVSDSKGGTNTITVTITVTDVDEADEALPNRPPAFASESTIRSIGETTIAGVKIGEPVSATDPDGDTLIYSLEGIDAASFKIVESTGQLKTKVVLDREIKPQYMVTVKVDDGDGGTDTITVTINILTADRPEPIMFVKQNGVVKHDQTVTPGTFELVMDFAQSVTGFEKSELGINALHTTVTITGWQVSNDGSDYIATVYVEKSGSMTFTVPENAVQAADDGQTNEEWKLFVLVMDNAAPAGRKGASPPTETLLLPNYPNPFNPETWIPYHLANASDVQITIYDTRGTVVRQLDLGHQQEGYYTSRVRAAYWDSTNELGESVASGVYFYQLQADNVSTLRKMLILK